MFDAPSLPKLFKSNIELQDFIRVWHEARSDNLLPLRSAISLSNLRKLAPCTAFLEYKSPSEVIYRMAGTEICERVGINPANTNIVEHNPIEARAAIGKLWQGMIEKPCGCIVRVNTRYHNGTEGEADFLYLPVEGNKGERLIAGYYFYHGSRIYGTPGSQNTRVGLQNDTFHWLDLGIGIAGSTPD